jgi:hypothetical protein
MMRAEVARMKLRKMITPEDIGVLRLHPIVTAMTDLFIDIEDGVDPFDGSELKPEWNKRLPRDLARRVGGPENPRVDSGYIGAIAALVAVLDDMAERGLGNEEVARCLNDTLAAWFANHEATYNAAEEDMSTNH